MKEKISVFALFSVGLLSLLILLYIGMEYILPVILPFIIAWLIAAITVRPAGEMSKKIRVPERILRLMMSLFLTIFVATALGVILWQIIDALWRFLSDLGTANRFYDLICGLFNAEIPIIGDKIPIELAAGIKNVVSQVLSAILSALASGATTLVSSIPQAFFMLVVTLISLVYFSLDYDRISRFVKELLPQKAVQGISYLKNGIFTVIKKYLLSYSLILFITFVIMLTGFMLLKVEHALVIALLVAFLDILPIIGVGTVLVPWSILEFASGNGGLGIGLLVLFVLNTVIRQLAEPKIVGKNLDLHPIATLILLYVGYSLFGFVGLIILPVAVVSLGVALKGKDSAKVG